MCDRRSIVTVARQRVCKCRGSAQVAIVPSLLKLTTVTGVALRSVDISDRTEYTDIGGHGPSGV